MGTYQTKLLQITAFLVGITIINQGIILEDDIKFVTEFPCLLGHPVSYFFKFKCSVDLLIFVQYQKRFLIKSKKSFHDPLRRLKTDI